MATIANFKSTYANRRKPNGLTVGCLVTLKDDGKVSITKKWGGYYAPDYYPMEKEIKDLITKEGSEAFKNPLFSNVRNNEGMEDKKFLELIRAETKVLLSMYIEKAREFAEKEFTYYGTLTEGKILEMYGIESKFFKGTKVHSKKSHNFLSKVRNVLYAGLETHLEKAEKNANENYNYATERVVYKIKDKGLVLNKVKVASDELRIKQGNLEMTFTDGLLSVNCFTILAWGEVNAPHYRYLIK